MDVRTVGGGPAIEALKAALSTVDIPVTDGSVTAVGDGTIGVVSAPAGADVFTTAAKQAERWIAIEIGGIGGVPLPDVAVSIAGFGPASAGYQSLRQRVHANIHEPPSTTEPQGASHAVWLAGAITGYELIELFSGTDRLTGQLIELPSTRRRILPIPESDERSANTGAIEWTVEETDLDTTIERAEQAVDDRIGIVSEIGERESFPAPYYLATLAPTTEFSDGSVVDHAAGVAADWDRAFMKALGEAIERYAAAIYDHDSLQIAPPTAIEAPVPPAAFVADTSGIDTQTATAITWTAGQNLATGTGVSLPARAVYFPPPGDGPLPAITTGLGAGTGTVQALVSGLTEVIERDAIMLEWYASGTAPALTVDDDRFEPLVQRAQSLDLQVTTKLVTRDIDVPVVSVAVHRDSWPQFAVGSAAALDASAAAVGALEEALQNWMELRSSGRDNAEQLHGKIGYYADRPPEAESFLETAGTVTATAVTRTPVPTDTDALETLLETVRDQDLSVYAARLTTPDIETIGFEVVRVLVPQAQPLFLEGPYFGERARTVPREFGEIPQLDRSHHPYP